MRLESLRKTIASVIATMTALSLIFAFALTGCSQEQQGEASDSSESAYEEVEAENEEEADESSDGPIENLEVTSLELVDDERYGKAVACEITNNTDYIYKGVMLDISGSFPLKNAKGKTEDFTGRLKLFCTGLVERDYIGTSAYLQPGANEFLFIPYSVNDIVYTNGDQEVTLDECTDFEVEMLLSSAKLLSPDRFKFLKPNEYQIDIQLSKDGATLIGQASITNKTTDDWRDVTIAVIPELSNGDYATYGSDAELALDEVYSQRPFTASDVAAGETVETDSINTIAFMHADIFAVNYVLVELD